MRTPNRSSHVVVLGLSALAGSLLALAACSDSLHLEPTPVPPGMGGSGGTGPGGGGGGMPCTSSAECAFPASVCDTVRGECVQCLEHTDCSFQPGTVCSAGACVCPREGEMFCAEIGSAGQPGYQPAGCVDVQTSTNNCGGCGVACFGACNVGQCAEPWEKTSMVGAPSARSLHVAVWAGDRMIVWGGQGGGAFLNTGGMYDPVTRTWTATSMVNAPAARGRATAVWTGTHMIVWGGEGSGGLLGDGAMLDPATNTWKALPQAGASPTPRIFHTAVWTGTDMIVWGGTTDPNLPLATLGDGARFDPVGGVWNTIPATSPRRQHSAVAGTVNSDSKMIVFGGFNGTSYLDTVETFDLALETWDPAAPAGSAAARVEHTAIWTGSQMIIWGGTNGTLLADGWRFENGTWNQLGTPEPSPRYGHTAVWANESMIVWGGYNAGDLNSGGIYDGTMWNLEMAAIPAARSYHTAVVTSDNRMIVWGGTIANNPTNTGAVFTPPPAP